VHSGRCVVKLDLLQFLTNVNAEVLAHHSCWYLQELSQSLPTSRSLYTALQPAELQCPTTSTQKAACLLHHLGLSSCGHRPRRDNCSSSKRLSCSSTCRRIGPGSSWNSDRSCSNSTSLQSLHTLLSTRCTMHYRGCIHSPLVCNYLITNEVVAT
jgi:hypothetical protein